MRAVCQFGAQNNNFLVFLHIVKTRFQHVPSIIATFWPVGPLSELLGLKNGNSVREGSKWHLARSRFMRAVCQFGPHNRNFLMCFCTLQKHVFDTSRL